MAARDAYLLSTFRADLSGGWHDHLGVWATLEAAQAYSDKLGGVGEWDTIEYDSVEYWSRGTADPALRHKIEGIAYLGEERAMTDDELDRLDALAQAATPGPWYADDPHEMCGEVWVCTKTPPATQPDGTPWPEMASPEVICTGLDDAPPDAAFIAASRDAVPALVAEVRRLRRQLGGVVD